MLGHTDITAEGVAFLVLKRKLDVANATEIIGKLDRHLGAVHSCSHACRSGNRVSSVVIACSKLRKVNHLGFTLCKSIVGASHPLQVAFQFCPTITQAVLIRIAKVATLGFRIIAIHIFPPVRETVKVAIVIVCPARTRIRFPALDIRGIGDISFTVRDSGESALGTRGAIGSVLGFANHALIVVV